MTYQIEKNQINIWKTIGTQTNLVYINPLASKAWIWAVSGLVLGRNKKWKEKNEEIGTKIWWWEEVTREG